MGILNRLKEVRYVTYLPPHEDIEAGVIYISRKYKTAVHLCACGYGCESVTPFGSSHGWEFRNNGPKITLSPSILNSNCPHKAHYFIRNNEILWV